MNTKRLITVLLAMYCLMMLTLAAADESAALPYGYEALMGTPAESRVTLDGAGLARSLSLPEGLLPVEGTFPGERCLAESPAMADLYLHRLGAEGFDMMFIGGENLNDTTYIGAYLLRRGAAQPLLMVRCDMPSLGYDSTVQVDVYDLSALPADAVEAIIRHTGPMPGIPQAPDAPLSFHPGGWQALTGRTPLFISTPDDDALPYVLEALGLPAHDPMMPQSGAGQHVDAAYVISSPADYEHYLAQLTALGYQPVFEKDTIIEDSLMSASIYEQPGGRNRLLLLHGFVDMLHLDLLVETDLSGVPAILVQRLRSLGTESPQDDFEFAPFEDGVSVTKYTGQDETVVVPWALDGKLVRAVSRYAFDEAGFIANLILPDVLTTLEDNAFRDANIASITLPSTPFAFQGDPLSYCQARLVLADDHPQYRMVDGVLYTKDMSRLVRYPNSDTRAAFEVPWGVRSIGHSAFASNAFITSVSLSDTVTDIGESAFQSCHMLQSVRLPASLTGIGDMAFDSCSRLKLLVLPDSLATIGSMAFTGRYPMLLVVSPGSWAEQWAVSVNERHLSLPPGGLQQDGDYLFAVDAAGTATILSYTGNETHLTVPDRLGRHNVRAIGQDAFRGADSLISVTMQGSLQEISIGAFRRCGALAKVIMPDTVTAIDSFAFEECGSLTAINLSRSLITLGNGAFYCCYSLRQVSLPEGLISLGEGAFTLCSSLETLRFPDSLQEIGGNPFLLCPAVPTMSEHHAAFEVVDGVLFDKRSKHLIAYLENRVRDTYEIPEGTLSIGDRAFSGGIDALYVIRLPESVVEIDDWAFMALSDKGPITLLVPPGSFAEAWASDNMYGYTLYAAEGQGDLEDDGDYTYTADADGAVITRFNGSDAELAVPDTLGGMPVTGIGPRAFAGLDCRRVQLPDRLSTIEQEAFADCVSLTAVLTGTGLKDIGTRAFASCVSLTELQLGEGLRTIESEAFYWCASLTSVWLPASLEYMAADAFSLCDLVHLYVPAGSYAESWAQQQGIPHTSL